MITSASEMSMVSRSKRLCMFECSAHASSSISAPANGRTGQNPNAVATPATPKVARQTLPKNSTAPRTLSEQCGVRSIWFAASNTAATIPATLLADSSTYELICGLVRPAGCSPRGGGGPRWHDGQWSHSKAARERFDVGVRQRHFRRHFVGDPSRERQSAGADGFASQQCVVETPEAQSDNEYHGQREFFRDVGHGRLARDGGEPAACPLGQHQV